MGNIFRGKSVSKEEFLSNMKNLDEILQEDIIESSLTPDIVINAVNTLLAGIGKTQINAYLQFKGMEKWKAESFVSKTIEGLSRESLTNKISKELGENTFNWFEVFPGIEERDEPLGTLLHIGAGNATGLSALSVLEGLLAGNINILKLPSEEGGLSSDVLLQLIKIQPMLMPYIYAVEASSKELDVLSDLADLSDAVVVWGSEDTVKSIRSLAPPSLPIIEWGHRLSFAYFTKNENMKTDLDRLAEEICITDQQYCSSAQCVFYESEDEDDLVKFAFSLSDSLRLASSKYPPSVKDSSKNAEITMIHELIRMEDVLEDRVKLIKNEELEYSVMIEHESTLKASPQFRNVYLMPIKRNMISKVLRENRGRLQTVGLSCDPAEIDQLSNVFYKSGINRICKCGSMSDTYSGEPHDGSLTLRRYVRRVSRNI